VTAPARMLKQKQDRAKNGGRARNGMRLVPVARSLCLHRHSETASCWEIELACGHGVPHYLRSNAEADQPPRWLGCRPCTESGSVKRKEVRGA
jgi:hypothetical protein